MKIVAHGPDAAELANRAEPFAHREPRWPTADSPVFAEIVRQLGSTLDSRFAHLDSQLTSVLRLLNHHAVGLLPDPAEPPGRPVSVSCLGPFQLRVEGATVDSWRSSKARALFQYLINHRGRPIPRETLIQALWPNPDAVAAGTSLKVAVHALRQTLQQSLGTQSYLSILAQDAGYQLTASQLWVDVEEFERCYALGRVLEAQRQPAQALAFYARAASLYRGDFLEELTDEWPMFRREALKDQYLWVLCSLAKAAMETGDYQEALVRCQQLLAKDRCREDAYRLLMICHGRLGQRGRVRTWYHFCVETLQTELDCRPEPETERVYRLALLGQA